MKKIKKAIKNHSITFWYLNLMICLMIIVPKSSAIFQSLHIRIFLLIVFPVVVLFDKLRKKITFNSNRSKTLFIIYAIFILLTIPSLFVTKNLTISIYTVIKFVLFFITFYLSTIISFTDEEKQILFRTLLVSVTITMIYGFISYFFGINLFKLSNYMYPGALGRIRSTFFNPCYYAAFINIVFTIFLYKLCISDKKSSVFYLIFLSALYACMIFTFTRSSVLIFGVLLIGFIFLFRKVVFKLRTLVLLVIIVSMSIFIPGSKVFMEKSMNSGMLFINNITGFLPNFDFEEEEEYAEGYDSDFNDYSLKHREAFAKMARVIAKDNPYTGVGFGSYIDYMNSKDFDLKYPDYDFPKIHPHASLILLYAETGFFSMIPFILFLVIIVFRFIILIFKSWKKNNLCYYYSSLGLIISAGFIVVSIMSENSMYDTQIFTLYLIIIGLLYNFSKKDAQDAVTNTRR